MTKYFILLLLILNITCEINILIIGETGVGKSSVINYLLNDTIAKINDYETGTWNVNKYHFEKYGQKFNIYDTPGLFDPNIKMNSIFDNISNLDNINVFLICYDLSKKRFTEQDSQVFKEIKNRYTNDILKHSIIVFTKANLIDENKLENLVKNRYDKININIPKIIAYDNIQRHWIKLFYDQMISVSKNPAFLIKVFDLKYRVCDYMNILVMTRKLLYPYYTSEIIMSEYNKCIENKNNKIYEDNYKKIIKEYENKEKKIEKEKQNAKFALIGGVISSLLYAYTGGLGNVLFDALGGIIASEAGSYLGKNLSKDFTNNNNDIIPDNKLIEIINNINDKTYSDYECKTKTFNNMQNRINKQHYDYYMDDNNNKIYEGYFENNLPHGEGSVYKNENILYKGIFKNGIPEDICNIKK